VWPSWPQACIFPAVADDHGLPLSSLIGSASMSARSPIARPAPAADPRITPTTPVRPIPSTTSSQPKDRSLSATSAAVRVTS
jgi:hypothetical protein